MLRRTWFPFLIAAVLATSGCATYRHRVSDDFRDAIKINVGVGIGLYAHVKATSFLDAGAGWGGMWANAGLEDRYTDFVHPSITTCPFPLGAIPGAIPDMSPVPVLRMGNIRLTSRSNLNGDFVAAGQLFDWKAMTKWDVYGLKKRSPHRIFTNDDDPTYTVQPCGFEAGVGAGIVNVSVGFDPVEFCDLLCTVCGGRLLDDKSPLPKPPVPSRPKAMEKSLAHGD